MKITEKIQKILDKANDPAASEEEALSLMAMAEKLMREHGITELEIEEEIQPELLDLTYSDPWRRNLVFAAARYFYCEALNTKTWYVDRNGNRRQRRAYLLIGREGPRTVAREMILYLIASVQRMAKDHSSIRREYLAYERGCGEGLAERLTIMKIERDLQFQEERTTGTDLIVLANQDVKEARENLVTGNIRTGKSDLSSRSSWQGYRDSEKIPINEQLTGSDKARAIR